MFAIVCACLPVFVVPVFYGWGMEVAAALSLMETPGADALEVAAACETVKAWADARQLDAIQELSETEPATLDPCGQLCDPVPAEIATALTWTPWTASRRVDLAHDLHDQLPEVLHALRAGQLDLAKATEIVHGTSQLNPGLRAQLAERALAYASGHTRAQLKAWLAIQLAKLDPEAAGKRRRKAGKQRRVWVQPETDGMATLGAYLTAEEAQACYENLRTSAANHEGGMDAARADLLVERLTGIAPAEPIPVQVIITPTGPQLAGHGPITPAHANRLCQGTSPTTLSQPGPTTAYTPTPNQTKWVRARDRHCRFPGCRRPATHCDLDHIIPHPHGHTTTENLACLCRYHHRLKTHTNWTVQAHPDNTLTWTSPRGHTYTTTLEDP